MLCAFNRYLPFYCNFEGICVSSHLFILAPSEAPANLSGYAVNSTTIALMWDTIAVENRNGIIRHYLVSVTEVETGEVDVYTAVATQLNISMLHPYYTYTCVVAAVTNIVGPFSYNISIITPQGSKYKISRGLIVIHRLFK